MYFYNISMMMALFHLMGRLHKRVFERCHMTCMKTAFFSLESKKSDVTARYRLIFIQAVFGKGQLCEDRRVASRRHSTLLIYSLSVNLTRAKRTTNSHSIV